MGLIIFIFLIFIIFIPISLLMEFKVKDKNKLKSFLSITLVIWLLLFITFFVLAIIIDWNNIILTIAFFTFVIYNILFLAFVRLFANKNNNIAILLFFPSTYLFVKNLLIFNMPTYYGALEVFAAITNSYLMIMILITYPFFIFLFSMIKLNEKIKGIMIILIALTSFIIGIIQPIGKEGYIADETGGIFILIIFTLIIIGICYILRNKSSFLNKHCS